MDQARTIGELVTEVAATCGVTKRQVVATYRQVAGLPAGLPLGQVWLTNTLPDRAYTRISRKVAAALLGLPGPDNPDDRNADEAEAGRHR